MNHNKTKKVIINFTPSGFSEENAVESFSPKNNTAHCVSVLENETGRILGRVPRRTSLKKQTLALGVVVGVLANTCDSTFGDLRTWGCPWTTENLVFSALRVRQPYFCYEIAVKTITMLTMATINNQPTMTMTIAHNCDVLGVVQLLHVLSNICKSL